MYIPEFHLVTKASTVVLSLCSLMPRPALCSALKQQTLDGVTSCVKITLTGEMNEKGLFRQRGRTIPIATLLPPE